MCIHWSFEAYAQINCWIHATIGDFDEALTWRDVIQQMNNTSVDFWGYIKSIWKLWAPVSAHNHISDLDVKEKQMVYEVFRFIFSIILLEILHRAKAHRYFFFFSVMYSFLILIGDVLSVIASTSATQKSNWILSHVFLKLKREKKNSVLN